VRARAGPSRLVSLAKAVAGLASEAGSRWVDDQCYRLGASLAYYALYSIFPLLLISVAGVGFLLGSGDDERARVLASLPGVSAEMRALIDETLASMQAHSTARGWGAAVGVATLVFGASGVFSELESSLDVIWRAKTTRTTNVWSTLLEALKQKALSFGAVIGAAVILLGSLAVSTALTAIGRVARGEVASNLWRMVEAGLSALCLTLLFSAVFHLVPHVQTRWRDVFGGAFLTSVLFVGSKTALAWYLARLGNYAAYGAVGAVLGLLTWIYVASLVLFYGAEFARVYTERYGSLAPPP
jgi:membrane protein